MGAGAWGTALADLLARNGHDTVLWAREPDVVDGINARCENARFLAGVALAPSLRSTGDVAGYRFFRQISDQGVTLEIFLECHPDKLTSADTWHQFLSSTRVTGLDAGAMR